MKQSRQLFKFYINKPLQEAILNSEKDALIQKRTDAYFKLKHLLWVPRWVASIDNMYDPIKAYKHLKEGRPFVWSCKIPDLYLDPLQYWDHPTLKIFLDSWDLVNNCIF